MGDTQTLRRHVLHILEEGPARPYGIVQALRKRRASDDEASVGECLPLLHELEGEGLVESWEETEGDRTRRGYRLTERGHRGLREERERAAETCGHGRLVPKEAL